MSSTKKGTGRTLCLVLGPLNYMEDFEYRSCFSNFTQFTLNSSWARKWMSFLDAKPKPRLSVPANKSPSKLNALSLHLFVPQHKPHEEFPESLENIPRYLDSHGTKMEQDVSNINEL